MYMGVIPCWPSYQRQDVGAPHVYGGDPRVNPTTKTAIRVLPMYMGVIPTIVKRSTHRPGAPHVYGGDPLGR